jgi:hypothetical protein
VTIHLSKKVLVALPLLVVALAGAAWCGAALADPGPTPLIVCIGASNVVHLPTGSSCHNAGETTFSLVTSDQLRALTSKVTSLQGVLSTVQGNDSALTGRTTILEAQVSKPPGNNSALNSQVTTLQFQVSALRSNVSALQTLLNGVTRPSPNTLLFSDLNLQVVNGTGSTDASPNGLGNLILGYNLGPAEDKTGSHDLVIGDNNTYTNTSGIVSGNGNTLSGQYALASGKGNIAGDTSFATGFNNTARAGSVATGSNNTASGDDSFATGDRNTASEQDSFASGLYSTASAGASFATGDHTIASGSDSLATGDHTIASGSDSLATGFSHTASGFASFVIGDIPQVAGPGTCGYIYYTLFRTC